MEVCNKPRKIAGKYYQSMNKVITLLCCGLLAFTGYNITKHYEPSVTRPQNTLAAATIPYSFVPTQTFQTEDFRKTETREEIKTDTVYKEIHDTVTVTNTKYKRVLAPARTDTIYISPTLPEIEVASIKNRSPGGREEQPQDEIDETNRSIILTVDGKTVYSSGNDNHSGGNQNDSTSVSDGLKKP